MTDRKNAFINISKGLFNVSLTTLAAIGSATGNLWLAGISTLPQAITSSGLLAPLLEKQPEKQLVLPMPPWWSQEPLAQTWQATCTTIEAQLPAIIQGVEQQIKAGREASPATIKQIFVEQVAQHLSSWEVQAQDRYLIAGYVTPPLLEASAAALKPIITTMKDETLSRLLTNVSTMLNAIQQAPPPGLVVSPAAVIVQAAPVAIEQLPETHMIAHMLEEKQQQEHYDVYICYHESDESEVMTLAHHLKNRGILPWLDLLEVKPGTPEMRQQQCQIEHIPTAAICVGEHPIIEQQELQMYAFIYQFYERELPVIPVLLASAPTGRKLPPYLGTFGRVDFRRSTPDPLQQFVWGITGKRP